MLRRNFTINAFSLAGTAAFASFSTGASLAMPHLVLLGDSVFDNAAYVASNQEVIVQLRTLLPEGWAASLIAVDGAVLEGVQRQIDQLPSGASHLIISAGGNDAIRAAQVLREKAASVAEALAKLATVREAFARNYTSMLNAAASLQLPVAICTIYNARFADPTEHRLAATALTLLNDVITAEAARRRLPALDLRVIFDQAADYANAIEPSAQGGQKLARAILALVGSHDFSGPAALYAGSTRADPSSRHQG